MEVSSISPRSVQLTPRADLKKLWSVALCPAGGSDMWCPQGSLLGLVLFNIIINDRVRWSRASERFQVAQAEQCG